MKNKQLHYIVFLFFTLFIVLPLVYTLFFTLFSDDFAQNLKQINKDSFILLFKSALIALSVAVFATLFGSLLAFLLYKTNLPGRKFFKPVFLIPLFISPYIWAVAWKDFVYLVFGNTGLISSYTGVILVLTNIFTPLSILIIGSALSNTDAQFEETGLIFTGLPKVILKITLPLIKPALISSFVLVFIFSISAFSVPAFFSVKVFTTEIFTQFSAFYNHALAILQSFLLVIICILLLLAERKYIADAPFLSVSSKGTKHKLFRADKKQGIFLFFLIFWLIFSVLLPIAVLFLQSFKNGTDKFVQAFYLLLPTFANSVELALLGAILTVLTGFVVAYFSVNQAKNTISKVLQWFLLIIFAIPSIIFGISLIKFYNRIALEFIYSSAAIIVIAYIGKFAFISAKIIENALRQLPKSLDEAAQIEGVGFYHRLLKILIPLIMPALFSAFIISFIFNFGELGISIMLYPPGTEIMPIKVFTLMANAPQSLTSSMTLIIFSLTLLLISFFYLIFMKLNHGSLKKY